VAQARRVAEPEPATAPVPTAQATSPELKTFEDVVMLFGTKREAILHALLLNNVHLVRFEQGRIDIHAPETPRDFAAKLMGFLEKWTGRRWLVTLITQPSGDPTLAQQAAKRIADAKAHAAQHPLVAAVLQAFPGATIEAVRGKEKTIADGDLAFDAGEPGETSDSEDL
jgi:DNA polymerase-3 subunit gamma/tau